MTDDELDDLTRRCAAGDPTAEDEYEALNAGIIERYRRFTREREYAAIKGRLARNNEKLMAKEKTQVDPVVGRKIVDVRPMTRAELEAEGWGVDRHGPPVVLVLDDGTRLYPARDDEGNGPGALFGVAPDGKSIALHS